MGTYAPDRQSFVAMHEELERSLSEQDREIGARVRRMLAAPPAQMDAQVESLFSSADVARDVQHLEMRAKSMEQVGAGFAAAPDADMRATGDKELARAGR